MFETPDALQAETDEVLCSGSNRAELSLLASESAVDEKLGHKYRKVKELEDNPSAPRVACVSTESIGDAEGGGIGGVIGSFLATLIGEQHPQRVAEQLDHGGLLLWVRVWDDEREKAAVEIMNRHSGRTFMSTRLLDAVREISSRRRLVATTGPI